MNDLIRFLEQFEPGKPVPERKINALVDWINNSSRPQYSVRQLRDAHGVADGGILQRRGEIVLRGQREVIGMGSGPSISSAANMRRISIKRFQVGEILTDKRLNELRDAINSIITGVLPPMMIQRPVPVVCGEGAYWITPDEYVATGHYRIWASSDHQEVFPGGGVLEWGKNLFLGAHHHTGFFATPGTYTLNVNLLNAGASVIKRASVTFTAVNSGLNYKTTSTSYSYDSVKLRGGFNGLEMKWDAVNSLASVYLFVVLGHFDEMEEAVTV